MKLKFLEFDFEWREEVSLKQLRECLRSKLEDYGEPLRWAITNVRKVDNMSCRVLKIEAVVILSDLLD